MAAPVIGATFRVDDSALSTSNQTRIVTTLGGTTSVDNVSEVPLEDISAIAQSTMSDIAKIDEIDPRTPGSTTYYLHEENHSTKASCKTLTTSSADAAGTNYAASGESSDTYPILSYEQQYCTESAITEEIIYETWTLYVYCKCDAGCASATYGVQVQGYLYSLDGLGEFDLETLLDTFSITGLTSSFVIRNNGQTVKASFNNQYMLLKMYIYMYELVLLS